jgi:hypothetical protein
LPRAAQQHSCEGETEEGERERLHDGRVT